MAGGGRTTIKVCTGKRGQYGDCKEERRIVGRMLDRLGRGDYDALNAVSGGRGTLLE